MTTDTLTKGISIRGAAARSEPTLLRLQGFHVLGETPCPYLPGRMERKLFTEILGVRANALYSELSRGGFRRSHMFAYRPACRACSACVPVRVDVTRFRPSRSQRRAINRNVDLIVRERPPVATMEQYRLFNTYLMARHDDGDMSSMTYNDYGAMVEETHLETRVLELRAPDQRLVAACLVDRLDDGFSAVYSFFDPAEHRRSLGAYMVLALVEEARRRGLSFVYLGYWVAGSPKMAYKSQFRPLQGLGPEGWRDLPIAENSPSGDD